MPSAAVLQHEECLFATSQALLLPQNATTKVCRLAEACDAGGVNDPIRTSRLRVLQMSPRYVANL
eukprot:10784257-Prorocentrum_lima.AAC.1